MSDKETSTSMVAETSFTHRTSIGSLPGPKHRDSAAEIQDHIISALAQIRVTDRTDIDQEVGTSGDAEIDSQEAMTVLAMLGTKLGCKLPGPQNLKPEQFTSIQSLGELIAQKLYPTS